MTSGDWTAPTLLETTGSYWQGCTIMAAVELDIFKRLDTEPDSAAGLAGRIGAEPRALGMLLRALAALGLLEQQTDNYRCSAAAKQFLLPGAAEYLGNIISHQHHLVESWARLDQAVTTGQPQRQCSGVSAEKWCESFLLGMQNLANLLAPQLVAQITLGTGRKMLDLGGGPGTWAIHFCRHNPDLRATIFDLPGSQKLAESAIADAAMTDRINFFAGDFNQSDLPETYDLIWMSHILHGEGETNCRALLAKAAAALSADGMLIIHEFILDDQGPGPVYPALFALNMLLGTDEGAAYTEGELREMLAAAGLMHSERLPLPPHNRSGVLLAGKTANFRHPVQEN